MFPPSMLFTFMRSSITHQSRLLALVEGHGVPYVVRPLGTLESVELETETTAQETVLHAAVRRMLKSAAAIHYTADEEKRAVEESLGLNHGTVIPLGVDLKALDVGTNVEPGADSLKGDDHP
jgi:hypothetical protein